VPEERLVVGCIEESEDHRLRGYAVVQYYTVWGNVICFDESMESGLDPHRGQHGCSSWEQRLKHHWDASTLH